jgi:hypothetical protein
LTEVLFQKLRRLHKAFEVVNNPDLNNIRTEIGPNYFIYDPGEGVDEDDLLNSIHMLVGNTASLKDHLKQWCDANGARFLGDELIANNKDVALIHDLWNTDKHGELDRKPRSGHHPVIRNIRKTLRLTSGAEPNSVVGITFSPDGTPNIISSKGASATHAITGVVFDRDTGQPIGDFLHICESAIEAWWQVLIGAGIEIPQK